MFAIQPLYFKPFLTPHSTMVSQKALLLLLAFICCTPTIKVFSQNSSSATGSSYTLESRSSTSAGVYKPDGTLVRTLWSGVIKEAGTYQAEWDGTDDFQQQLPVDNYNIKVISNNVQYSWQGTIGNSSKEQVGPNIHRSLEPPNNIAIAGDNAYYAVGYAEKTPSHFQFALDAPQVKLNSFDGYGNQTTHYVCTDGTNLYWTGWDNYQDEYSWAYATKVSDNSLVNFSNGSSYQVRYGKKYSSVIDLRASKAKPSGIAVSSNYIFVSYRASGFISVLNKNTGALVRTIAFTTPSALAIDGNNIWICSGSNTLNKYPINSDGTLGGASTSIAGLSSPADVRVNGTMLAVVDGGTSQQIKTYNTTTGSAIWTLGQMGGSLTSPVVANDRFGFWIIGESDGVKADFGGIAFASDGTFWICDPSNRRMLHYDGNRNFIESIIYQAKTYTCFVDPNNHSKVFANLMEFQVDYTTADIKKAWTHKYNWEGTFKAGYGLQEGIKNVTTLSNGRTYGLVTRAAGGIEVVELLPSSGLRYTGVLILQGGLKIYPNGDIYSLLGTAVNETQTWQKKTLTGFDASNNPVYTSFQTVLTNSETDIRQPRLSGSKVLPWEVTSSNVLACFKGNAEQPNGENVYHLGGLNVATGKWIWKTSLSTSRNYEGEFPTDGFFDIGNGSEYQGNVAMAIDRNIIWGYHGEFWKGSQVNKWNHYYDNGLFVGQFGFTGPEFNDNPIKAAGFAGNAFSPSIIKEGDDYYMYHNDESVHGGILRWKITGLNTIKEQTIPITSSYVRTDEKASLRGVDLMAGLPDRGTLTSNTAGWTITPSANDSRWTARSNFFTYDKRKSPDLYVTYNVGETGVNTINRDLGQNSNLSNWEITGKLGYHNCEPNSPDGKGLNQYLDVLDNSGKIIVRFYQQINYTTGTTTIYANNAPIFGGRVVDMKELVKYFLSFVITKSGSNISVTYNGKSAVVTSEYDREANMSNPTTLRLYFSNVGGMLYEKFIGISDFRFITSNVSTIPAPPTIVADDAANTLTASHPLGTSEILVSENGSAFVEYPGQINVGVVERTEGYWRFKTKASLPQRNESDVVNSPAFFEVGVQRCSATGTILHEVWNNVSGAYISSNNWSNKANNVSPLTIFEAPSNIGDNYAARIRGFICAPQSGNYTFWISGDDATELWLSTDADPANKRKIAFNTSYTAVRNWERYASQRSVQIYLKAGYKYYIEALHKEEYGEDHLAVAWQLPDGSLEAPIAGSHLSPFNPDFVITPVTPCSATGTILHEVWNNVNGSNINSNNWSKKADNISPLAEFEAPQNFGDNFAARIRGYICPPESGNYTFWISGDDATELWLSTDADPANKIKIAYSVSATYSRNWGMFDSQKSFQIYLRAGNKYYIEALHKEASGADHLAVAWQFPSGSMEAPIAGSHLSPFDPDFDKTPVIPCSATGTISHEVWNNVNGLNVNSNNWNNKSNSTTILTALEAPQNIGDNYAARIRGYICPPLSGNYTFWISGDDATELWLSTDSDPGNKIKIAYNVFATYFRNWSMFDSQKSFKIYLRAGNKYYIEALHKEVGGADHLSVAWQLPDGTMEAPIPGSRLSPFNPDFNTTLNARVLTGTAVSANESLGANTPQVIANQTMSQGLIDWKIYPNPIIGNNISIQSGFIPKGDYNLLLVNGLGQTIFKKSVAHGGGPFNYSISLSSRLSKGSYVLNISGKDVRFTKKLLK